MKEFNVYIMASECNKFIYIGFTNNLSCRVRDHQSHRNKGYTEEYKVNKLVYYERYHYVNNAISREKQLKKWNRTWKNELINKINPNWLDLAHEL